MRVDWRAGVSGKNVADEVVMIHETQRRSRLSSDHSREEWVSGIKRRGWEKMEGTGERGE